MEFPSQTLCLVASNIMVITSVAVNVDILEMLRFRSEVIKVYYIVFISVSDVKIFGLFGTQVFFYTVVGHKYSSLSIWWPLCFKSLIRCKNCILKDIFNTQPQIWSHCSSYEWLQGSIAWIVEYNSQIYPKQILIQMLLMDVKFSLGYLLFWIVFEDLFWFLAKCAL